MDTNESDSKERLNNLVAITVALLAAFMAVTKVKDDNICQVMVKEKSEEVNTWARYQSKSIKQNLAELGRVELVSLGEIARGDARKQIQEQVDRYDSEIARYKIEKEEIQREAEQHGKNYETLNFRDDQFDLSDAVLSISLAMLAVTALTAKRWLLVVSWGVAAFGVLFGVAGLVRLNLHPDWIVRLLS